LSGIKKFRVINIKFKTQNVIVLEVIQLLRGVWYVLRTTVWYLGAFFNFVLHRLHFTPVIVFEWYIDNMIIKGIQ
jgi:hypothetical protein